MPRLPLLILLALLSTASLAQPKGATMTATETQQTAYLSGGCFWGMEELVREIPGVLATEVGYTGGGTPDASYEQVKTGNTGHAESLKVVFDRIDQMKKVEIRETKPETIDCFEPFLPPATPRRRPDLPLHVPA